MQVTASCPDRYCPEPYTYELTFTSDSDSTVKTKQFHVMFKDFCVDTEMYASDFEIVHWYGLDPTEFYVPVFKDTMDDLYGDPSSI